MTRHKAMILSFGALFSLGVLAYIDPQGPINTLGTFLFGGIAGVMTLLMIFVVDALLVRKNRRPQ